MLISFAMRASHWGKNDPELIWHVEHCQNKGHVKIRVLDRKLS